MNRTTAAQRANARYDKIWAQYEAQRKESDCPGGVQCPHIVPHQPKGWPKPK